MRIAVVIVNWDAVEDTRRCVQSMKAWETSTHLPRPTIWVVDNGSREPGIRALGREDPEVRLLLSSVNQGFAGGSNRGIQAALDDESDAVLLLNNDATLSGEALASMATMLRSHPDVGVVGPQLWDGDRFLSAGGRDIALHLDTHVRSETPAKGPVDVEYVPGTAALIHRRVFEEVGLLDEAYFFGGEMADLCRRARGRSLRSVTDPRARADHDLHRSSAARGRLHLYYVVRNRFLYVRKHHRNRRRRLFFLWGLRGARAVASALVQGQWARARSVSLGVVDGLSGRFGGQNERVLG